MSAFALCAQNKGTTLLGKEWLHCMSLLVLNELESMAFSKSNAKNIYSHDLHRRDQSLRHLGGHNLPFRGLPVKETVFHADNICRIG
jgi:hypothetical protein